jgi:hypothetical protein
MKALIVGFAVAASAALGGCAVYPAPVAVGPGYAEPAPAYVAPSVVVAPAPYYGYGYYGGYRGYRYRHWR